MLKKFMMIREGIKKSPDIYRSGASKMKNKRIRELLDLNIANMGVDLGAGYAYENFKQMSFVNIISVY